MYMFFSKLLPLLISCFQIYCDHSKSGKNAKEAPSNSGQAFVAEAAKLEKFSDSGRPEFGGCPMPADSHFLSGRSMQSFILRSKSLG